METLFEAGGQKLIIGNESHLAWAGERVGISRYPDDAVCLAIVAESGIKAVVIYNYFTNVECEVHIVSNGEKHFATRGMISAIFAHPFVNCGLRRVTTLVKQFNVNNQCMLLRLGFKFEGVKIGGYADDNQIVMGMLRDDCIWIEGLQK